jgi:hypothetical protein
VTAKNRNLIWLLLVLVGAPMANAGIIERIVTLTPDGTQFFSSGEYGSGVFWRPDYGLTPFTLDVGDTIDVTITLAGRIFVTAGVVEQESVGGYVDTPLGGIMSTQYATFEFLDYRGSLLSPSFAITTASAGGIGANFNPVDLTDSMFSFSGVRYSLTILSSSVGLPALFDHGFLGVQSQGEMTFRAVPEPSTILLLATGLFGLIGPRRSKRAD